MMRVRHHESIASLQWASAAVGAIVIMVGPNETDALPFSSSRHNEVPPRALVQTAAESLLRLWPPDISPLNYNQFIIFRGDYMECEKNDSHNVRLMWRAETNK